MRLDGKFRIVAEPRKRRTAWPNIRSDPQEYAKLYREYADKLDSAWTALATHGLDSVQFTEADQRAGVALKVLKAAHRHGPAHWAA